ncbi:MAG: molybdopterin dinucleotide binding domain-containing protein [Planctomycetaceae bacterium]
MVAEFILIPGRSSRQGVTLNEGKYTDGYLDETSTLRMHPEDMQRLGIGSGDEVRMWNDVGEVVVPCIDAKDECPEGIIFICYGDKSSQLMAGETHGSGMPDSKGLDVFVHPANQPRPEDPKPQKVVPTKPVEPRPKNVASGPAVASVVKEPAADSTLRPVSSATSPSAPAQPSQLGPTLVMGVFILALIVFGVVMAVGK